MYCMKHPQSPKYYQQKHTEIINEPLGKMTDAISWQNCNIKSIPHFMNSRRAAFDRSAFNATNRGHKSTIMSSGIKKSVCADRAPLGSGCLPLYHRHHHHTFMPHSCPHQFIQHVIEVNSAHSIAVYTVYESGQNSRIACIKVAQALMRNCRRPPRTNLVLTSE